MGTYSPMSPRLSSPAHPSSGGVGAVTGAGRGRGRDANRRDKELIGQTVRIVQGPYKGEVHILIIICHGATILSCKCFFSSFHGYIVLKPCRYIDGGSNGIFFPGVSKVLPLSPASFLEIDLIHCLRL